MFPRKDQYAKMPNHIPPMLGNPYISPTKPSDEQNYRYFSQCSKLIYTAFCIKTQFNQFVKIKESINDKITSIQKNIQDIHKYSLSEEDRIDSHKPRRFRRTNSMIQKTYKCNYDKCDKIYASEGSLHQHIKLKHQKQSNHQERPELKNVKICEKIQQSEISEQQQEQSSNNQEGQNSKNSKNQPK